MATTRSERGGPDPIDVMVGLRLRDFKLLAPTDMADLQTQRKAFNNEWNGMLGL